MRIYKNRKINGFHSRADKVYSLFFAFFRVSIYCSHCHKDLRDVNKMKKCSCGFGMFIHRPFLLAGKEVLIKHSMLVNFSRESR